MTTADRTIAAEIREILDDPHERSWSIQGFGMLRLYLDDQRIRRLHIWDPVAAVEEVSTIHDHPWDFVSEIVSGEITNVLYDKVPMRAPLPSQSVVHQGAQIQCGEGGGVRNRLGYVPLLQREPVIYHAGTSYSQHAEELHDSFPVRGAVTVITRHFRPDNTDIANVFWRGGDWVSAEPRPATEEEITHFVMLALETWRPYV